MNLLNISKDNKQRLSYIYLFLSIIGAILPMMANFDFAREYGNSFDIKNFILLANKSSSSIIRDLLIGARQFYLDSK